MKKDEDKEAFVSSMLKKAFGKDEKAQPYKMKVTTQKDPETKPHESNLVVTEIEEIVRKIKDKVK